MRSVRPPDQEPETPGASNGGRDREPSTRLLLVLAVLAVFVVVVNGATTNVALPTIQTNFGVSEGQATWVITGYLLVFAVGIPLYGRLADVYSLRKAFCFGLVVFAAGSLACALAPTLVVLVAGRVVQAAGAAAIPALSNASVARLLPPGERGVALGLIVSSVGVGAAIGPVIGGAAVQFAGWHSLFYGVLVLAVALIPVALYALPDTAPRTPGSSFDVPGGVLLALSAGLALFGVTQGQVSGYASPPVLGIFAASAVCAALFFQRITTVPEPFVSPRLLANRAYVACGISGFLGMLANLTSIIFVPLLLSQENGLGPGAAGLVLAPGAVVVAILSPLAGRLSDRLGTRPLVLAGIATILVSMLFLSTFGAGASALILALGTAGVGAGFSFFNSPNINAAAATLSDEEVGVGLGIYQMLFFLGGGFGPALMGSLLAARRGSEAINPFYTLDAPPFSDVFLVLGLCALAALIAASLGRPAAKPKNPS